MQPSLESNFSTFSSFQKDPLHPFAVPRPFFFFSTYPQPAQEKQDSLLSTSASVQTFFFQSICSLKVQPRSRLHKQGLHAKPQLRKAQRFIPIPSTCLNLSPQILKMIIPTLLHMQSQCQLTTLIFGSLFVSST